MSSSVVGRKLPWWKKILFSICATLLFFGLIEAALAIVGVEPLSGIEDPFAGFSARIPHFVTVSADGEEVVRLSETKRNHFHDLQFTPRKASGSTRVFCVGGSTTYGRPFWDETSFAGWLRALLASEDPSHAWGVLNAGGISYASYRVVGVMRELAQYDPDVFVVYVGQNEFLEYRTYKDLIEGPGLLHDTSALLSRTRIAAVLRDVLPTHRSSGHTADELPDLRAVNSVGPDAYTRDEPLAQRIVSQFEAALEEMVRIAEDAGARIVFVVPASNLADFKPFKSEHRPGLAKAGRARFDDAFKRARHAARQGRWPQALAHLDQAERIDDRYAELLYLKAKALSAVGRPEDAATYFRRAKDEDIVPLRAISAITDAVRAMGERPGVGVIDFDAALAADAEDGVPGEAAFADHVHPKTRANGRLGELLCAWLLGRPPTEEGQAAANARVEAAIDGPRYAAELVKLSRMLEWLKQDQAAMHRVEEALALVPDDFDAGLRLATLEMKARCVDAAMARFEHLLCVRPDSAPVHAGLGIAHAARGQREDAREHLERSVALDPDYPLAHEHLAVLLAGAGRFEDALPHFQAVVRITPQSAQAHSNLGLGYAKLGKTAEAEACYRDALRHDGAFVSAHYNYGLLLEADGRSVKAAEHFRAALRANPRHAGARQALGRLRVGASQ